MTAYFVIGILVWAVFWPAHAILAAQRKGIDPFEATLMGFVFAMFAGLLWPLFLIGTGIYVAASRETANGRSNSPP